MSELMTLLVVTLIGALGTVLTVLLAKLTKKGLDYLDARTSWLDTGVAALKKEALKNRIVEVVTLTARATNQTFVDDLKAKAEDGKLTKAEAVEAFQKTMRETLRVLKTEGIETTTQIVDVIVEAVVGKLGAEKKAAGGVATPE